MNGLNDGWRGIENRSWVDGLETLAGSDLKFKVKGGRGYGVMRPIRCSY